MTAPVLLPAALVRLPADRPLLAVAGGAQARFGDAERDEVRLGRLGPALAEREVVLVRAALVAVPLDRDGELGPLPQEIGVLRQPRAGIVTQLGAIEIEVDVAEQPGLVGVGVRLDEIRGERIGHRIGGRRRRRGRRRLDHRRSHRRGLGRRHRGLLLGAAGEREDDGEREDEVQGAWVSHSFGSIARLAP